MLVFPDDIKHAICIYLQNPSASSCTDLNLMRVMQQYDQPTETIKVENLAADHLFAIPNGRVFRKQQLVRKRYRCVEIKTGRVYLFNPLADIKPII